MSLPCFLSCLRHFLSSGINRRAYASGLVDVRCWNPRDYAEGNYRRVDDRPFGGGPGMVMMAGIRCNAAWLLSAPSAPKTRPTRTRCPLVLFSPIGADAQPSARWRSGRPALGAILLCGRYEGIDQRFIDADVNAPNQPGRFCAFGW